MSNINLLPLQEKRSALLTIILCSVLIIGLIVLMVSFVYYQSLQKSLKAEQTTLQHKQELRELKHQKLEETPSVTAEQTLADLVDLAASTPVSAVHVLHHATSLLPERGFFTNYRYSDEGNIELTVQFDQLDEVASYLHALNQSPKMNDTWLNNVNTTSISFNNDNGEMETVYRYVAQLTIRLKDERTLLDVDLDRDEEGLDTNQDTDESASGAQSVDAVEGGD